MGGERFYYAYILASAPNGTLYIGMTNDLARRMFEHREGLVAGFTKTHNVKTLVHYEIFPTAAEAIRRETRLKKYPRAWKINLILSHNPGWDDLAGTLV